MKLTRPRSATALALLASLAVPVGVLQAQPRPEPRPAQAQEVGQSDTAAAGAETQQDDAPAPLTFGLAGPYLAARMAAVESDFRAAARYFAQAVAHDPEDRYLLDSALVALVSAGDIGRAVSLSSDMESDGRATELSALIRKAELVHQGNWQSLLDQQSADDAEELRRDDLLDRIVNAWALMGAGRASDALSAFETLAKNPDVAPLVNYHLALARAMVGDYEGADALLSDEATGAHMLGFTARAEVLAQLERRDEAVAMLDGVQGIEAEALHLEHVEAVGSIAFDEIVPESKSLVNATSPDCLWGFRRFLAGLLRDGSTDCVEVAHLRRVGPRYEQVVPGNHPR